MEDSLFCIHQTQATAYREICIWSGAKLRNCDRNKPQIDPLFSKNHKEKIFYKIKYDLKTFALKKTFL